MGVTTPNGTEASLEVVLMRCSRAGGAIAVLVGQRPGTHKLHAMPVWLSPLSVCVVWRKMIHSCSASVRSFSLLVFTFRCKVGRCDFVAHCI